MNFNVRLQLCLYSKVLRKMSNNKVMKQSTGQFHQSVNGNVKASRTPVKIVISDKTSAATQTMLVDKPTVTAVGSKSSGSETRHDLEKKPKERPPQLQQQYKQKSVSQE